MGKIRLSELRQWQWHCLSKNKCYECEKASDCFDRFGSHKPLDFVYKDGVIKRAKGSQIVNMAK